MVVNQVSFWDEVQVTRNLRSQVNSTGTCEVLRGGLQDFPSPSQHPRRAKKKKRNSTKASVSHKRCHEMQLYRNSNPPSLADLIVNSNKTDQKIEGSVSVDQVDDNVNANSQDAILAHPRVCGQSLSRPLQRLRRAWSTATTGFRFSLSGAAVCKCWSARPSSSHAARTPISVWRVPSSFMRSTLDLPHHLGLSLRTKRCRFLILWPRLRRGRCCIATSATARELGLDKVGTSRKSARVRSAKRGDTTLFHLLSWSNTQDRHSQLAPGGPQN